MKTLIIIRHAKAEHSSGVDSHRKLSERGHHDAEAMAKMLLAKGYRINKIFSSPADRTRQTTEYFAKVHGVEDKDIKFFDDLYLGDTLQIIETINWLQENINTLAIVGHNPGVTNFTNDETPAHIDSLPTAGVAVIEVDCEDWQNFDSASKKFIETFSPKSE